MSGAKADAIAAEALTAFDEGRQIEPFSKRFADFDTAQAYAVTAAVRRMRRARGETPVGRKIGFTNRNIWQQYKVDCPIWGDMYDTSVRMLGDDIFPLARLCEPQIEPEIVLRLSRAPEPEMDERALLDCVEWVAPGFEIVQSIFPGWRFAVADTIAAFGMHGALLLGPELRVTSANRDALFEALSGFSLVLRRDGEVIDRGEAANVLGGPLSALRHLARVLAGDPHNPPLAAGEIVTTGTLTRAFPIKPGESWAMQISGIGLADLAVRFG